MGQPNVVSLSDAVRDEKRKRRGNGDGSNPPDQPPPEHFGDDACPITPLGMLGGTYWFFDINGELRSFNAQQISQAPQIVSLFGGNTLWPTGRFPQYDKEGNPTNWFNARLVGRWLVEQASRVGLFQSDMPRRGVGVWAAGDSAVALHMGDIIRWLGDEPHDQRAGFSAHGALWPRAPRTTRPGEPASADDARSLEAAFERWNWERKAEAAVFLGLWAAGLLGAAIRWRPHGLVVGGPGTGKTTLLELYASVSPLAFASNDFTEAGIRQTISGRAAPLILDEAEGDIEGMAKMQRVIELLRRASGGEGARTARGSAGGQAQQFQVMSPAILGAVLPPSLLPADASRITRVDLMVKPQDGPGLPDDAELARLRTLAPALWSRALNGLPRFRANLVAIRKELLGRGCVPRLADQVGTILAAREMMVSDATLSDGEAHDLADDFRWLVRTEEEQREDGGPQAALNHILQSTADITWGGEHPTFGRLIRQACNDDLSISKSANDALQEHGLMVAKFPKRGDGPLRLYVADKHPRLAKVFVGTQWAGGRWKDDLRRLPGAEQPPDPQWIGSAKPRCVVLPRDLLPSEPVP
jgi:hypothetical protein